jgi:transcriptional regulator with XRE-family HTH domain
MPLVTTVEYDGQAIRDRREYLGYSLADISRKTGRRVPTLSDVERNRHPRVSKQIIGQIARVLRTDPDLFIKATHRPGKTAAEAAGEDDGNDIAAIRAQRQRAATRARAGAA